jgi:hypothetical protein
VGVDEELSAAQRGRRRSAIDERTTRHAGEVASQRCRKRIEEVFGWITSAGGFRQARHRGVNRVRPQFTMAAIAYNHVHLPRLIGAPP